MKLMAIFPPLAVNKVIYIISFGGVLILFTVYLAFDGLPFLLSRKIKENIALNNGTKSMKAWQKLPMPLEFKIYVFNVTNPDEVSQGKRPILDELGPYVYDEHQEKTGVKFLDNDMIAYKIKKTYFFNQEKSGCHKEADMVTVLNIPLLGTAYMVEERFPVGLSFLNNAIPFLFPNISDIFLRVPVGQLFFHGIPIKCDYETGPAMPVCRGIKSNRPPPLREDPVTKGFTFSMFQAVNSTPSKEFKIYRGNKNIYDLGKIVTYNNLTYLEAWDKNTSCSILRGTDSSILPPIRESKEDIYLYLPDVCLSLRASFEVEDEMRGIKVYKYISAPDNFASPKTVPSNICRCKKNEDNPKEPPKCLKSGAIDATKCQGAPVILTPPHFLQCDEEYQSYPVGLSPNRSKHETQVYIEPNTGVPLAAAKRIQMNMFLRKLDGIELLANVSEGLFPIIWVEEAIAEEMVDSYTPSLNELMNAVKIMQSITWLLIGIGLFCIVVGVILLMKTKRMMCFRENQVISNISFVGNSLGKDRNTLDDKRGVFSIPTSRLGNEVITVDTFGTNASHLGMNSDNFDKKTNNPLPR